MKWNMISMGDIALRKGGSVDPKKHQDEVFELYSIPAFDTGAPEVVAGSTIGSSKKAVQPNDVMISRIVPHIRRACVVGPASRHRQIASGEWIIFRDERIWPKYLRWLLVGDVFHSAFMRTVSGVGGSLLRARPAEVFKIQIPLPPHPEQRRIAEILDKADTLRAKRRATIAQLDTLTQSIFLDMFGDPATNPKRWPVVTIADICEVKGGKRLPKGEEYSSTPTPHRYIRVMDLKAGRVDEAELVFLRPEIQAQIAHYVVNFGDVIISIAGSIGLVAPVPATLDGVNLTENAAKLVPLRGVEFDAVFLAAYLQTPHAQSQIKSHVGQVTIGKLALFRIEKIKVPLPALALQCEFVLRVSALRDHDTVLRRAQLELDALFASLQQRAFRGDL